MIYPAATVVRAYVGQGLLVGEDGVVTEGNGYAVPGQPPPRPVVVPARQTAVLDAGEVAALRRSLFYTQLPSGVFLCTCSYGHALTFYDSAGRFLGGVLICFHCGCFDARPEPVNDGPLPVLNFDQAAVERLFGELRLAP